MDLNKKILYKISESCAKFTPSMEKGEIERFQQFKNEVLALLHLDKVAEFPRSSRCRGATKSGNRCKRFCGAIHGFCPKHKIQGQLLDQLLKVDESDHEMEYDGNTKISGAGGPAGIPGEQI